MENLNNHYNNNNDEQPMTIETEMKLLRLKSTLNKLQDISFSYKRLITSNRIDTVGESRAQYLIKEMDKFVIDLEVALKRHREADIESED